MHEEYFGIKYESRFNPSFWFMLKLKLFGKKIIEHSSNGVVAVWYLYKDVLYMTDYSIFG